MKKFSTMKEAFDWWAKHIYPALPPDVKKGRYTSAWKDYTYQQGISEKRMENILSDFGKIDVKIEVTFTPN